MRKRRRTAADRARSALRLRIVLIWELGGRCVDCGERDWRLLEFDHKFRRTWDAAKTSRWQRMAIYRREACLGLIELRCGTCNKKKGRPPLLAADDPATREFLES